ncbi:hypothetical protein BJY52DRAFT_103977 [Lactarius psammicola]|nr:hypothetical protein BJY52DRAFT_103977 [Lactarius psammicola]
MNTADTSFTVRGYYQQRLRCLFSSVWVYRFSSSLAQHSPPSIPSHMLPVHLASHVCVTTSSFFLSVFRKDNNDTEKWSRTVLAYWQSKTDKKYMQSCDCNLFEKKDTLEIILFSLISLSCLSGEVVDFLPSHFRRLYEDDDTRTKEFPRNVHITRHPHERNLLRPHLHTQTHMGFAFSLDFFRECRPNLLAVTARNVKIFLYPYECYFEFFSQLANSVSIQTTSVLYWYYLILAYPGR